MLRTKAPKQHAKKSVNKVAHKKAAKHSSVRSMNTEATFEQRAPTRNKIPVTGVKLTNKQATADFRTFVAETAQISPEGVFVMRDGAEQALVSIPNNESFDVETIVNKLNGATFANNAITAHNGLFAESLGRKPENMFTACLRILPFTKDGADFEGSINVPDFVVASKLRRVIPVVSVQATPRNPAVFRIKLFDQAAFWSLRESFDDAEERVITVNDNGEFVPLKFTLTPWKTFPRREAGDAPQDI